MEKYTEESLRENRKINRRLIVIYKAFANDLLFYYTISYLFLVNVKGLTTAQVVFGDSFYPFFKLFFQLPCTILIQKIGKKKSLVLANFSIMIYVLFMIGLVNTTSLIIGNIFCAFGFVTKGLAESNLLFDSLENTENKRKNFSKLDGTSGAYYYLIDAITAILSGYLFTINPYIPMFLSLFVAFIASIISIALREVPTEEQLKNQNEKISIKAEISSSIKDNIDGFKYILKSKRLLSLITFNAIFISILSITLTLKRSLLNDINVSSTYFGIIFSILSIISFISSAQAFKIHEKLRNKALTYLGIAYAITTFLAGLVVIINIPYQVMFTILMISYAIQAYIKGPYYTLIKQYYSSFVTSDMRLKIHSVSALFEYAAYGLFSFGCSFILENNSNAVTTIILGSISLIIITITLAYMLHHVGLNPEDYSKEDLLEK